VLLAGVSLAGGVAGGGVVGEGVARVERNSLIFNNILIYGSSF
jgi:hypothetical protein